jgi:hypothetical protein
MAAPPFILFMDRLLGTAHLMTLAPPRVDGGKHILEARLVGGLAYVEEYADPDEAAGRYLELASSLLGDPGIAAGVRKVDDVVGAPQPEPEAGVAPVAPMPERRLADVTPLPTRGALLPG